MYSVITVKTHCFITYYSTDLEILATASLDGNFSINHSLHTSTHYFITFAKNNKQSTNIICQCR